MRSCCCSTHLCIDILRIGYTDWLLFSKKLRNASAVCEFDRFRVDTRLLHALRDTPAARLSYRCYVRRHLFLLTWYGIPGTLVVMNFVRTLFAPLNLSIFTLTLFFHNLFSSCSSHLLSSHLFFLLLPLSVDVAQSGNTNAYYYL